MMLPGTPDDRADVGGSDFGIRFLRGLLIAAWRVGVLRILPAAEFGERGLRFGLSLCLQWLDCLFVGSAAGLKFGGGRPVDWPTGTLGIFSACVWVLAAGTAMLRIAAGLWRLRRLRKSCRAVDVAELEPSMAEQLLASGVESGDAGRYRNR